MVLPLVPAPAGGTTPVAGGSSVGAGLPPLPGISAPGIPAASGPGTGPDATTAPSNLGGAASGSQADGGTGSLIAALNALPPTAAGLTFNVPDNRVADQFSARTLPDPIGFPVVRLTGTEVPAGMQAATQALAAGEHRLFVFQGISSERLERDGAGLRIPRDAFAHTDPSAIVLLEARLADGRPLPGWLSFDRIRGTFSGEPPRGLDGDIEVEVVARDSEGREARTLFQFSIDAIQAATALQGQVAQDSRLGLDVDAEEAEKARLEAERQAQERATENRAGAKSAVGKPPPAGAKTFSEQLRGVQSARDPLLDRVAGATEKGPTRTP